MSLERGPNVCVFPGQNAVKARMASELIHYPSGKLVFEQADDTLDLDLTRLCTTAPEEEITKTSLAQPANVVTELAYLEVLKNEAGIKPQIVAGHSLGEYAALVAAGCLTADHAIRLVASRGKFLQEQAETSPAAMAVLNGLTQDQVELICQETGVEIANINSRRQLVIAGLEKPVDEACANAREKRARVTILPFGVASHCSLAEPVAAKMAKLLAETPISDPNIPFLANVTGRYVGETSKVQEYLIKQLVNPVLWLQIIENLLDQEIHTFYEVGSGHTLTNLTRRIAKEKDPTIEVDAISTEELLTQS